MAKTEEQTTISLGSVKLTTPKTQPRRMSIVIWGPAGSGKTTLAATAPRPILWMNFDVDGTSALMDQEEVLIADYETMTPATVEQFMSSGCAGLKKFLSEHPEVKTVVFDSVTSFRDKALLHGVDKTPGATIEQPQLAGYGKRNTYLYQAIIKVTEITRAAGVHCVLVAHEAAPQKDEVTGQLLVSMLVGGNLQTEIPIKLSEVWYLEDDGKKRKITIRSSVLKRPMKSRMFISSGKNNFKWLFDPEDWKGEGIEEWFDRWMENDGRKIPLPN